MARSLRLEVENGIFHVASRGWDRLPLFNCDADRFVFLELLEKQLERFAWICLSYVLMDNHYHLVLRTPQANLSRGMQNLNQRYATAYNRRRGRPGAVFERRFRGVLIQQDAHLLEVFRYVALNPVRAGMCDHPSAWPWSAHRAIVGQVESGFVAAAEVHSYFEGASYAEFVRQRTLGGFDPSGVVDGDEDFVRDCLASAEPHPEVPRAHWGAGRPPLKEILAGADRDEAIATAYLRHGYTMAAIAAALGCHVSTVSRRLKRYEA